MSDGISEIVPLTCRKRSLCLKRKLSISIVFLLTVTKDGYIVQGISFKITCVESIFIDVDRLKGAASERAKLVVAAIFPLYVVAELVPQSMVVAIWLFWAVAAIERLKELSFFRFVNRILPTNCSFVFPIINNPDSI